MVRQTGWHNAWPPVAFSWNECCRLPLRISPGSKPARRAPWRCLRMPSSDIRGRAKWDGALHEGTALNLASQALGAIKSRNNLDTTLVDDVVMGVVDPDGEAAADIARTAALVGGFGDTAY